MVFLKFILDPEKEVHWIDPLEKQLIKLGKLESFEIVVALVLLMVAVSIIPDAAPDAHTAVGTEEGQHGIAGGNRKIAGKAFILW